MTSIQIKSFLSAARYLNFSRAAEELFLSQPTISRNISLLEDELGFLLFVRDKKELTLTPAGIIMRNFFADESMRYVEHIQYAKLANHGFTGYLSIGCLTGTNTNLFILPPTSSFSSQYPNVEITLEKASFGVLRKKLERGELDVIFTLHFELPGLTGTNYLPLYPLTTGIILSKRHPLADKQNLSLFDLQHETFLLPDKEDTFGREFEFQNILQATGMKPVKVKTVSNLETLIMGVQLKKGVGIANTSEEYINDEAFIFLPIDRKFAPLSMVMVYRQNTLNPALPLFINAWKDYASIDAFLY